MKVKQLLAILQKQDPELSVELEGCDCIGKCIGYTVDEYVDGKVLFLRVEGGVLDWEGTKKILKE